MATKLTKRGKLDNEITYEFVCDTPADLQAIDKQYIVLGSTAIVLEGDVGFEVYMANSQQEWVNIGGGGSNNSGSSEPAWVNQDIITSIPESLALTQNNEIVMNYQKNMQLNNHIITGTLFNNHNSFIIAICSNSEIPIFNMGMSSETADNLTKECYLPVYKYEPSSNFKENDNWEEMWQENYLINYIYTIISAGQVNNEIQSRLTNACDYALQWYSSPDAVLTTITFYKMPVALAIALYNQSNSDFNLVNCYFSTSQPDATYDVSQLTYETPQAGE